MYVRTVPRGIGRSTELGRRATTRKARCSPILLALTARATRLPLLCRARHRARVAPLACADVCRLDCRRRCAQDALAFASDVDANLEESIAHLVHALEARDRARCHLRRERRLVGPVRRSGEEDGRHYLPSPRAEGIITHDTCIRALAPKGLLHTTPDACSLQGIQGKVAQVLHLSLQPTRDRFRDRVRGDRLPSHEPQPSSPSFQRLFQKKCPTKFTCRTTGIPDTTHSTRSPLCAL